MKFGLAKLLPETIRRILKTVLNRLGGFWGLLASVSKPILRRSGPPHSQQTPVEFRSRPEFETGSEADLVSEQGPGDEPISEVAPVSELGPEVEAVSEPGLASAAVSSFESVEESLPVRSLEVADIARHVKGAVTLEFDNRIENPVVFRAGQYLTLVMDIQGTPVQQPYYLCSDPFDLSHIAVTVKRQEHGRLSNFINDYTVRGDRIECIGPAGEFGVTPIPDARRQFVLVGSGPGIGALLSIIRAILRREPRSRVDLVYGSELLSQTLHRKELDELAQEHENLTVTLVLSRPSTRWKGPSGLLEETAFQEIVPRDSNTVYLVCGPEVLIEKAESILTGAGVDRERIRTEVVRDEEF